MVARGTLAGQRTVSGTLAEIAARVAEAELRPPAITVVGPVAELRETLAWLERRPLHGEVVAVTRARAQASELAGRLRELGRGGGGDARRSGSSRSPVELPEPPDLLCFTSPNGVRLYFDALAGRRARRWPARASPPSARAPRPRCASAASRRTWCRSASWRRGCWRRSPASRSTGKRVLVARAAEARDVLPDGLRERGAEVDVIALYETVAEPLTEAQTEALKRRDVRDVHVVARPCGSCSTRRRRAVPGARPRSSRSGR